MIKLSFRISNSKAVSEGQSWRYLLLIITKDNYFHHFSSLNIDFPHIFFRKYPKKFLIFIIKLMDNARLFNLRYFEVL